MTSEISFSVPSTLDINGALAASKLINDLPKDRATYLVDFSTMDFVEPFGMLYFVTLLRKFRKTCAGAKFIAKNYEKHSYAAHMGFFKAFGLNFGNSPGEAKGSPQYVPINCLEFSALTKQAHAPYQDERELLEQVSHRLASVLVREQVGDMNETLTFSLREIFRNALEHAKVGELWYAAQYWPQRGTVELCVVDEGIGIHTSLRKNPHLNISNDSEALKLSLLPGVSGVAYKGGPRQKNDPWANSGYGLFMTSQLCQAGGSFVIISGENGLKLQNHEQSIFEGQFEGTAIRLQFNVSEIRSLSKSLENLRKKGAQIAGAMRNNANITASMSSRMLISKY